MIITEILFHLFFYTLNISLFNLNSTDNSQFILFITSILLILFFIAGLTFLYFRMKRFKNEKIILEDINATKSHQIKELQNNLSIIKAQNTTTDKELNDAKMVSRIYKTLLEKSIFPKLQSLQYSSDELLQISKDINNQLFEYAKNIQITTKEVRDIIRNMLTWNLHQQKELCVNHELIYLKKEIIAALNDYALRAVEKNLKIDVDIPENLTVVSDKYILTIILQNIISDSISNSYGNGKIKITCDFKDNKTILSVKDSGKGFAGFELETIFFTKKSETYITEDNNIGLILSKNLADELNVDFLIESTHGAGTNYVLQLPFSENNANIKSISTKNILFDIINESLNYEDFEFIKKKKILIIDDNESMLFHIEQFLSGCSSVFKANNGRKGLDYALQIKPDIIICDLIMPDINGIELTKELRRHKQTRHIPILLLTARHYDSVVEQAYIAGINEFIPKPFDEKMLLLKINNIFRLKNEIDYITQVSKSMHDNINKDTFLQKVIDQIRTQKDFSNLTVENLAEQLQMSKSTLIRRLKNESDKSPSDIINDIKFERAKQLLRTKQYSVAEVAWEVGFNEVKYFSKKFKSLHNVSPKEYMDYSVDK